MTSMFTVPQQELAIRTQFGAILGGTYEPGLHFQASVGPGGQVRAAHPEPDLSG